MSAFACASSAAATLSRTACRSIAAGLPVGPTSPVRVRLAAAPGARGFADFAAAGAASVLRVEVSFIALSIR